MSENCENLVYLYKKCLNEISVRNSIELAKTTSDCFFYWNKLIYCMDKKRDEQPTNDIKK
jgi:hypothetical protein